MTYTTDNWVNETGLEWINDELKVKGNIIIPTVNILMNAGTAYPIVLQIIGSAGFVMADAKHSKISVKSGVYSFGVGLNFGVYISSAILISTSPAIAIVDEDHSYGFNIGLIILTNKL